MQRQWHRAIWLKLPLLLSTAGGGKLHECAVGSDATWGRLKESSSSSDCWLRCWWGDPRRARGVAELSVAFFILGSTPASWARIVLKALRFIRRCRSIALAWGTDRKGPGAARGQGLLTNCAQSKEGPAFGTGTHRRRAERH